MALSPKDLETLRDADLAEAESIEANIDEQMREKARSMSYGKISIQLKWSSWSYALRQHIEDRYKTAGWKVDYKDDQREGTWIEFTY